MSDLDQLFTAWMDLGPTAAPDRVAEAARLEVRSTRQTATYGWWPPRRYQLMNTTAKVVLAAAVLAIALIGYSYLVAPKVGLPEPTASADASPATSVAASLPALTFPGTRGGPPGEYGWEGAQGSFDGMHRVVGNREATAMFFAVGPNCLESMADRQQVEVHIAGFEGVSVEPYLPAVMFNNVGDEITRAYALDVDERTLCVFVTWHPTTSDQDRDAAFEILDSLRAEPSGRDGVRITFTLRNEWDTG